ncbi:MAG: hypothetical protein ABIH26_04360 [Candidatus Eisenbacteria bacterium]
MRISQHATRRGLPIAWLRALLIGLAGLAGFVGCGDEGSPAGSNGNRNPVIDSISVSGDTILEADTLRITVHASDPDGDTLVYLYQATHGTLVADGPEAWWIAPNTPGGYSILASVIDGRGGVDSRPVVVAVVDRPTGISGTATLANPAGPFDLIGARLALYTSEAAWRNNNPWYSKLVPESGAHVYNFILAPVPPGTYYLDIWKDINGNEVRDDSDLFGLHGTGSLDWPELHPIEVRENEITILSGAINVS